MQSVVTTAVVVVVSGLHVQVVAVAIDFRGMVMVVTASAISADTV